MQRRDFLRSACLLAAAAAAPGAALAAQPPPRRAAAPPARRPTRAQVAQHNAEVVAAVTAAPPSPLPWRWIVIHHTAAEGASLAGIDRYHAKRFEDPLGCQYHFLIGNGRRQPAGWIEPARWRHQARAIHLFHPERAPDAVAISHVANLEARRPTRAELDAVVDLTRALMAALGIDADHVTTHRRVDGRLTQCPGKHFPFAALQARLRA
jgi:hypothetical protein